MWWWRRTADADTVTSFLTPLGYHVEHRQSKIEVVILIVGSGCGCCGCWGCRSRSGDCHRRRLFQRRRGLVISVLVVAVDCVGMHIRLPIALFSADIGDLRSRVDVTSE